MSFREIHEFTELMVVLGYPTPLSVSSFRTPNFPLTADILYWIACQTSTVQGISRKLETEDDRISYIKQLLSILASNLGVNLDVNKVCAADGHAMKELLGAVRILHKAKVAFKQHAQGNNAIEGEIGSCNEALAELDRWKANNAKSTIKLCHSINDRVAKLLELLQQAESTKCHRQAATIMHILETMTSPQYETTLLSVEQKVRDLLAKAKDQAASLTTMIPSQLSERKALQNRLSKKREELCQTEKRFQQLQSVRPVYSEEYENIERNYQAQFAKYVDHFRNLDYLENCLSRLAETENQNGLTEIPNVVANSTKIAFNSDALSLDIIGDQATNQSVTSLNKEDNESEISPITMKGSDDDLEKHNSTIFDSDCSPQSSNQNSIESDDDRF